MQKHLGSLPQRPPKQGCLKKDTPISGWGPVHLTPTKGAKASDRESDSVSLQVLLLFGTRTNPGHSVDRRNPALPKKPGNDESSVHINKQWFPTGMVSKWCNILSIHRSTAHPTSQEGHEVFGCCQDVTCPTILPPKTIGETCFVSS